MKNLIKHGFDINNAVSYGNMFLIGNGHLGYRGTLEEFNKEQMVGLNVVGFYDKYKRKWRESLNIPNPFYINIIGHTIFDKYKTHKIELDINKAIFKRKTIFNDLIVKSERFISQSEDNLLCLKYMIKALTDKEIIIKIGTDIDVYEINGPHYVNKSINEDSNVVYFTGLTNEHKHIYEQNQYIFPKNCKIISFENGIYTISLSLKRNKTYTFYCFSYIMEHRKKKVNNYCIKSYKSLKKDHIEIFTKKFQDSDFLIKGNNKALFCMRYSIYHLLILGNEKYKTSIPARGVSGQPYKGAIFWDSEIFMLPFFTLTNPLIAKNLLLYRINTLKGALKKAKQYGYDGAFYAWESQEKGQDGCSNYNVSDPITNKPIRTYFKEKQIHISADISYGLLNYIKVSNDESILNEGGLELLMRVNDFYLSYATLVDNKYHLLDVIGPDEYHERVDDNAFTNYIVYYVIKESLYYLRKYNLNEKLVEKYQNFIDNLYLPIVSKDNLIEQFKDYYKKEDVLVDDVRKRIKHKNEYWGTKNGVAFNTRVIKQADVVTLLVLLSNYFNDDILKANFDFYYKYTEHGSSLSASMYSILASFVNKSDIAYKMFIKSADIDLGVNQKMYAGGVYIGGTHPASNAGAYISLIFGICGLKFVDNKVSVKPNLPKQIKGVKFKIKYQGNQYLIDIDSNTKYKVEQL